MIRNWNLSSRVSPLRPRTGAGGRYLCECVGECDADVTPRHHHHVVIVPWLVFCLFPVVVSSLFLSRHFRFWVNLYIRKHIDTHTHRATTTLNSIQPKLCSSNTPLVPLFNPFNTQPTMSVARTTTQALRTRVAPTAARSSLRTRGTGYRFNSSQSGPNVNAGAHPAVTGAAAGAAAALLVGYGAYKYTVSFGVAALRVDPHVRPG